MDALLFNEKKIKTTSSSAYEMFLENIKNHLKEFQNKISDIHDEQTLKSMSYEIGRFLKELVKRHKNNPKINNV